MGFFDFLKREKENRNKSPVPYTEAFNLYGGNGALESSLEMMGLIDFIGGLIGSLTIKVMEKKDEAEERITDGMSYLLDIAPCERMTRMEWMKKLVKEIYLEGRCYVYPQEKDGYLYKLKILEKSTLKDGVLFYVEDGQIKQVDEEKCLKFAFYSFDVARLMKEKLQNIKTAMELKKYFLKTAFKPNLQMILDGAMTTTETTKIAQELAQSIEESRDNNRPYIVPRDSLELVEMEKLTYSNLGVESAVDNEKLAIANAIGVPPFLLGVGNYNAEEYNAFIKCYLLPKLKMIEQTLSLIFYSPFRYVKFSTKSLYQFGLEEQTSLVNKGLSMGYITGNEAREFLGFERVNQEELDEFRILENYIPLDMAGEQKKLKDSSQVTSEKAGKEEKE